MKLVIVAALAAAALARPTPARACSCEVAGIEVHPRPGVTAPTNTRVWLLFPGYEEWRDGLGVKDEQVKIEIRPKSSADAPDKKGKGKKKAPSTVEASRVDVSAGKVRVIELAPKGELAAKTHYQVVITVGDGNQEVVGEFKTGDKRDDTPPTFAGLAKARVQSYGLDGADCHTGATHARLALGNVADEGGPGTASLLYGIWISGDDGKVHYEQPPATYVTARSGALWLGHWSMCATPNYALPADGKIVVGVRAIDLAGNKAETAGEAVLDLTKVVKNPPAD